MTNDEFKTQLSNFQYYLKPALFTVLYENAELFSEVTKKEIVEKLQEADSQMQELYDYQKKRNTIMQRGLQKIQEVYKSAKNRFQAAGLAEQKVEAAEAENLISKL